MCYLLQLFFLHGNKGLKKYDIITKSNKAKKCAVCSFPQKLYCSENWASDKFSYVGITDHWK